MSRMLVFLLLALAVLAGVFGWVLLRGEPAIDTSAEHETPQLTETGVPPIPDTPYWSQSDRWVEVDDLFLRVRENGDPSAPAIILIHGFSHSLETWELWAADLEDEYRVIRFDLPGHGLTGPDAQSRYSVDETVRFLGGLVETLDVDSFVLAGNSLGGLVAWRYAAQAPDRVSDLILLAPGGYSINGVTEDPVPVPAAVSFFLHTAPRPMVDVATRTLYGSTDRMPADTPRRVFDLMRMRGNPEAMVQRLSVFTLPDPSETLQTIEVPTLILWGSADSMVPPEHGPRFDADIPVSELVTYDGYGHVLHEEAPAETLAELRRFLAD